MNKDIKKEEIYIIRRKIKALFYSLLFLLCRIFPVKNNKICFSAFEGGGYGCNPKYIAEKIHEENLKVQMVWLVKDIGKKFPSYIRPVKDTVLNRVFHMSTSRVWIDNSRQKYGTLKRKSQLYIQTWHGQIGFKPVGRLRGSKFSKIAMLVSKHDAKLIDFWLSNSSWSTDTFERAFFGEPILEVGSPRLDALISDKGENRQKILEKTGLDKEVKYVIYAPTFRSGSQLTERKVDKNHFSIDFDSLIQMLHEKMGGEWKVLLRLHPQIALKMGNDELFRENENVVDVSLYDDIYELLAISEVLVTDYSSVAFDAAVGNKIVFIYSDDYNEYVADRGDLLWAEDEIPFDVCACMPELENAIKSFDEYVYEEKMEKLKKDLGIIEDGNAGKRVVEIIKRNIGNE